MYKPTPTTPRVYINAFALATRSISLKKEILSTDGIWSETPTTFFQSGVWDYYIPVASPVFKELG